MNIKRLFALLLALCMVFSLCACSKKEENYDDDDKKTSQETENTEKAEENTEPATEPPADPSQPTTGIKLSATSMELTQLGQTKQLTVTTEPAGRTATFESSAPSVATVDQTGLVTAIGLGTAYITVTCDTFSATCVVNCNITVTNLTLSATNLVMTQYGQTQQLTATIAPAGLKTTFESNAPDVATVSETGLITAIGPGTANITVTCGNRSATCVVNCELTVTGLTLATNSIQFTQLGQTQQLEVITEPAGLNAPMTFESVDPEIATVDSTGLVTAKGRGVTTITVTCGEQTTVCIITCNFISGLTMTPSLTLNALGACALLSVTTTPATQDCLVTYTSSDPDVATVDQLGKVTATGRGVTTITASCDGYSAVCIVTCDFYNTDPVYEESDLTFVDYGYGYDATFPLSWGSYQLYNGKIPADKVTFASTDEAVATVDSEGKVTFVGVGRALITATYGEWTITFVLRISDG